MNAKQLVIYNINRLIEENKSSQAELARVMNVETLTVHNYTKGHRFPKPESMDAICRHFKVPITELFKEPLMPEISTEDAIKALAKSLGYEIIKKN
jgi:transcriptional regulator with XRE-family HTH domain